MKSRLITLLLTCACASLARADFNPVALTPRSYTYDIVVGASTAEPLPYCINVTAGDGVGLGDNTYYEQGLFARPGQTGGNSGIPVHNTVFTNINNANMTFLMPPDYTVNNELMIDSTFTSGTLTFNSATTATNLAILCTGGGGSLTVNYTVTHSDNSTETGTLSLPDWFDGGSAVAWGANGRIQSNGGYNNYNSSSANNNPPYLYANKISVSSATPITSIAFDSPSSHHGNFYAVSGNASGTQWTPIPVNPASFNVIGTVPAAIPFPITASMDTGTNVSGGNTMNTWFEQGYVPGGVSGGLPPSGSVFSSQSQPTHFYQMGDYSTNNAILVDQNHQLANITPASPASYSALAFLTAGANISGNMTNICIIQHANGVNETNIFLGYDWFDSSHSGAIALYGNGRVDMGNRTLNNVGNNVPYLFETYFTLADTASPVTNIVVKYSSAPSGSSTTYVMAISASAGGIAPLITSGPVPATQSWLQGQTATFTVSVTGTVPLTNSWLADFGAGFVPLTDGVTANGSKIFGSGTTSLVISNLAAADSGTYKFVASNAFGSQEGAATLTVLAPGNSLEWSATGNSGVWDTGSSANWINLGNSSQTIFNTGDMVLFDDTVGVPTTVAVSGTVFPTAMTVNSSTNNFTINGTGTFSGPGSLVKNGSSTLTLNIAANFNGSATINGGTVVAGFFAFANAASVTITNNSTMDFGGSTMVNHTPITVSGTGVANEGAIFNSGGGLYGQVLNINLAGDTTFGGSSRWDLGAGSQITGSHKITVNWSTSGGYGEWDSVTLATNVGDIELAQGQWAIKGMGDRMGDPTKTITVDSGTALTIWGSSVGPNSGYNKNFHILTNAIFAVRPQHSDTYFNGNVTLEDGAEWDYFNGGGGGQTNNGTYTLNGIVHMQVGDSTVTFTNVISGTGGFVWNNYNNKVVFTAANTYSGPTVIGDGRNLALSGNGSISHSSPIFFGGSTLANVSLDVSGRPDKTLTLASGQTLGGIGTINGSLVVASGATLSPAGTNTTIGITTGANVTGTIAATNAVTLNGTTVLKLNGSGVNDQIQAGAGITFGGTLNLVNVNGTPLANGNSFQIFNAPSYIAGSYTITPATPGAGLAWDTSQLNTFGTIGVVTAPSQPVIGGTKVLGGNLIFSGTGGTANGSYAVLTSTNIATPIGNWTSLVTNSFDGTGAFSVTNAISGGTPQLFYRIKQLP